MHAVLGRQLRAVSSPRSASNATFDLNSAEYRFRLPSSGPSSSQGEPSLSTVPNFGTTSIVHWNTVYLERAVQHLKAQGASIPDDLLPHVAPLGWEHIA